MKKVRLMTFINLFLTHVFKGKMIMEKLETFNTKFKEIKEKLEKFSEIITNNISDVYETSPFNRNLEVSIIYDEDDEDFCGIYKLSMFSETNHHFCVMVDYSQSSELVSVRIHFESDYDDIYRYISFISKYTKLEIELKHLITSEYITDFSQ